MYEKNGEKYYICDAHIALWDARPENQRNIHGKQFIDCFYDYHKNLSPAEVVWDYDTYTYYGEQPFNFWGFPFWYAWANSLTPVVAGAVMYKLREHHTGWRQLSVIVLIPMVIFFIFMQRHIVSGLMSGSVKG